MSRNIRVSVPILLYKCCGAFEVCWKIPDSRHQMVFVGRRQNRPRAQDS